MIPLARRYLDRKTKEHYKRLARSGEFSSHITEKGAKIPDFDETLGQKRIIYLQDVQDPKTISELINEQIGDLCRTAEETSKYIELVNEHLDKQKLKIDDLKKMQKTFENQMRFLTKDPEKKKISGE